MGTISKMAERCQKCPDRDKCNHKRMEMCAYIDEPKATVSNSIPIGMNVSIANVGGFMNMNMGDIAKEIERSLNKNLSMKCGW